MTFHVPVEILDLADDAENVSENMVVAPTRNPQFAILSIHGKSTLPQAFDGLKSVLAWFMEQTDAKIEDPSEM